MIFGVAATALLAGCASQGGGRGSGGPVPATAPPRLSGKSWISSDGSEFPFTRWAAGSRPEKVVVAIHGLSGAASDFCPLGEYLSSRSTAVYSYELRGQGNDPQRDRVGDIRRPELWYADLDAFLTLAEEALGAEGRSDADRFFSAGTVALKAIQDYQSALEQRLNDLLSERLHSDQQLRVVTITGASLGIALVAYLMTSFFLSFVIDFRHVVEVMRETASGNLRSHVKVPGSDELAAMKRRLRKKP